MNTSEQFDTVITSKRGWFDINLRELFRYRDLILMFVKRNFIAHYKQTVLGPAWAIIQPLLTTVVFTIVFGNLAKLPTDGVPPFLFYMCGNVAWGYFAGCLTQTAATFTANAGVMGVDLTGKGLPVRLVLSADVKVESFEKTNLIPGGELFGVRMEIDGLIVSGTGPVEGTNASPASMAGIVPGDRILSADGVALRGAASFTKIMAKTGGKAVRLTIERNGEEKDVMLTPMKDTDGVWRAGLWVREAAAGIGTVTFIDPETGAFAGLGHGICDGETGKLLPLKQGTVCTVDPESVNRASREKPGEIRGELSDESVGSLRENTDTGVYGTVNGTEYATQKAVPIALKDEISPGKVEIQCQLDEEGKKTYDAVIEEICDRNGETKNFVLRITDEELLAKTGGIIQGMSGSPILQNGKLIGAVTHVMLRDPQRGYGIFIENMLKGTQGEWQEDQAA